LVSISAPVKRIPLDRRVCVVREGRIDVRPARVLCQRRDGPDYLVLNARINGYPTVEWPLPPEIGPGRQSLFLYACQTLATNEKGRR